MRKYLLASAAALTLMTGAVFAQSSVTTVITGETSAPTVITPPVAATQSTTTTVRNSLTGEVSKTREHTSVDADGREVKAKENFNASPGHVDSSTSTSVKNPDGSSSSVVKQEWSNRVIPQTSTSSTTTTTTKIGQ